MNRQGIVALTTLIIVSSVLLVSGITLLLTSADIAQSTDDYNRLLFADLRSRSCLEEAIYTLRNDPAYVGSVALAFPDSYPAGSCSATITDAGGGVKNISVQTNYEETEITKTYSVNMSVNPPVLSN